MKGDPTGVASDSADAAQQSAAASGSSDAEIDLSELIDLTRLKTPEEFKAALRKESVVHWMSMSRLELLQHLKSRLGVEKLADRQAIANGFGRKRRAQNGDPPPPVPIKPPDWFTAQAQQASSSEIKLADRRSSLRQHIMGRESETGTGAKTCDID